MAAPKKNVEAQDVAAENEVATDPATEESTSEQSEQEVAKDDNEAPANQQETEAPKISNAKVQPEEPAHEHAQRNASSVTDDEVRGRWTQAKAVLYTDGLSGAAGQNLERAYEINERLQSNDPDIRRAGDESLSPAADGVRDERDKREAKQVIEGGRQ